jgi:transcriptional regulator with XRE-family HTH domain
MPYKGLENLTKGERLVLDRRRREERQAASAARLGVSLSRYSLWERDKMTERAPLVKIGHLTPAERCLLRRRREGWTQEEVAAKVGVCRWWLNQMEQGKVDCTELLKYWEQ